MIDLSEFIQAQLNLNGIIKKTAVDFSANFSEMYGEKVYLKPENLQKTGSFKIRGAYNCLCNLSLEDKAKGVIAFSAGNHAQGVAFAASQMDCKAVIVMPEATPEAKVRATEGYGARVIKCGGPTENRVKKVQKLIDKNGYTLIHPFDNRYVIAGQGTIGLELLEDDPELQAVVVPVSGGGLISGIATVIKKIKPEIKIIGVQPEKSDAMYKSFNNKEILSCDNPDTVADALIAQKPGKLPFELVLRYVDDIITVSEQEIIQSCLLLAERAKLVVEPGGAVALSAIINKKIDRYKKVVAVLSGGNVDIKQWSRLLNKVLS